MTPAHNAAKNQNIEVIKLIISNGGDINMRDNLGLMSHPLLIRYIKTS